MRRMVLVLAMVGIVSAGCAAAKSPARFVERTPAGGQGQAAEKDRKLVRNASLTLKVTSEEAIDSVLAKAQKMTTDAGGYISAEYTRGLVLRIPNDRLEEVLGALSALGDVARKDVSTVDVTEDYYDLKVRIDNAQKLQVRLKELLKQAQNVHDVLEVEKELSRVTTELERLEGQMRLMENRTTLATVNLSVEEKVRPGPLGWVFYGAYVGVRWLFVWD